MKTEKKANQTESHKFTSGTTITEKEFKNGIKDDEKGPFYSVQESMNHFETWLEQREAGFKINLSAFNISLASGEYY